MALPKRVHAAFPHPLYDVHDRVSPCSSTVRCMAVS